MVAKEDIGVGGRVWIQGLMMDGEFAVGRCCNKTFFFFFSFLNVEFF